MKIYALQEGAFVALGKHQKQPLTPLDKAEPHEQGGIAIGINPFVLIDDAHVTLLDTGLGTLDTMTSNPAIIENLSKVRIRPDKVTRVLFSHLHYDHIGGSVRKNHEGKWQLNFPNATHYFSPRNLESLLGDPQTSSEVREQIKFVEKNAKVCYLDQDKGHADKSDPFYYEHTQGHCPNHLSFLFTDDKTGRKIFYGGDEAPQLSQMKMHLVAKYDIDGRLACQLRHDWWEKAKKEKWTMLFYHDIDTPIVEVD